MTGVVRTVGGDVPAGELGFCSAHDHILIGDSIGAIRTPDLRIDSVERAVAEVQAFVDAGGSTLVDAMPVDCGRDPAGLVEVSRRTGCHIVATTGFHKPEYYEERHWSIDLDVEEVVGLLVAEVVDGMDRHSYGGPVVERLEAKAGLVKVATDGDGLTPLALRRIDTAAEVHRRTGVPVLTHTEHGALALEQIEAFSGRGVAPDALLVSHVDRCHDRGFHRELAGTGAYLVYDGPSRTKYHTPELVAELMCEAAGAGGADRVLVGMDLALRSYRTSYGGEPGLAWLPATFVDVLDAVSGSDELGRRAGRDNPARALSLRQ